MSPQPLLRSIASIFNSFDSITNKVELYKNSFFASDNADGNAIPIQHACAILRLANKYQFPSFRTRAINELKKYFPSTLAIYDAETTKENTKVNKLREEHIILAINTAHANGALEILPCAFYLLCLRPLKEIFDASKSIYLSREYLEVCMRGRDALRAAVEFDTLAFVFQNQIPYDCTQHSTCPIILSQILRKHKELRIHHGMDALQKTHFSGHGLCTACVARSKSVNTAGRQKSWNSLPEWLGLGSWTELLGVQAH